MVGRKIYKDQPTLSHPCMLYQLSYQAPWEQRGGEEGIQVPVLGAITLEGTSLTKYPEVTCCHLWHLAETLQPLGLNASMIQKFSPCIQALGVLMLSLLQ